MAEVPGRVVHLAKAAARRVVARRPQVHNMHQSPGEQFYLALYRHRLDPFLTPRASILDLGCQYGRFTIPLVREGHRVLATDIEAKYGDYIRSQLPADAAVEFRQEDIRETVARCEEGSFDLILGLEVLYVLPDFKDVLAALRPALRPDGVLVTSHRSYGYYVYRFLAERSYDRLEEILAGRHPYFNCHTSEQLGAIYDQLGYSVLSLTGIGLFSGIVADPFAKLSDPDVLSDADRRVLAEYESRDDLQKLFRDNARYLLAISKKT
ncbi:MAG: class I SAM-dependent methyltransferase [Actinomycetota bacterium]|nr:class I SAM-dependent methyltransferase [Actinomycetota bacterium]